MRRFNCLFVSSLLFLVGQAYGQRPVAPRAQTDPHSTKEVALIRVGDRVRIRFRVAEPAALVGTVAAVDSTGLLLRPEGGGASMMIGRDSLRSLEVSGGVHSSPGRGAGIGLLAGAAAGALIGFAVGSDAPASGWGSISFSAGEKAAAGAIGGAALGGVVGLLVGASTRHERWRKVSDGAIAVGIGPRSNGAALAVTAPF